MEESYRTKHRKLNRKREKSSNTILSISSNSDNSFPDLRASSNQGALPPSSNATTLSERSELAKIAKELKEDSKNQSPIQISDSDSEISVSFSSSHIHHNKESEKSVLKNQTEELNQRIKHSLQELRKEANLYMDSSHRALQEFSTVTKRMKESVISCQSDGGRSSSPASADKHFKSSFACNYSPESFIHEQIKSLQKDIQLMQIRLTESELALHNKGQENDQLKELLKSIEQRVNMNRELIMETEEKRQGCTGKCQIM
ncbi:unnamed protein product [Blepharisma stoltei]|uniref:Uncharacterized protein n=1 Tax=Blepharisma stoltei TaxID=1481888 RepID=A0AAU9J4V0_9CILI|nr:unnamed protein product [Blepharisma stoltei]